MAVLIGTTDQTGAANTFFFDASQDATKRTCDTSGTLESLTMVVRNSSVSMSLKLAIWADSAGAPGALLGQTDVVSGTAAVGTFEVTADLLATVALTSGTDYWLGFLAYGATFNAVNSGTAGTRGRNLTAGTSSPANPFGSHDYTLTEGMLIRGDGTASGGGGGTEDQFVRVSGVWLPSDRQARANGVWV